MDALTSVARQEEGVSFYSTNDESVAAVFGLDKETKPVLVLLKEMPDKRLVYSKYKAKKFFSFEILVQGLSFPK